MRTSEMKKCYIVVSALLAVFCNPLFSSQGEHPAFFPQQEKYDEPLVVRNEQNTNDTEDEDDSDDDQVGNINETETTEVKKRKKALNLSTFGFGPAAIPNLETGGLNYHFYGGYIWEPHPNGAVKSLVSATTDFSEVVSLIWDIGGNFYVLPTDFSPYVGASLGLGYIHAEGENHAGFTGSGSAGVMMFRSSDVHLNLEFKAVAHLQEVNDLMPIGLMGLVGISF